MNPEQRVRQKILQKRINQRAPAAPNSNNQL